MRYDKRMGIEEQAPGGGRGARARLRWLAVMERTFMAGASGESISATVMAAPGPAAVSIQDPLSPAGGAWVIAIAE